MTSEAQSIGRIRFLLVADTPGHTAGYHVVARGLMDAGIEVVLGGYAMASEIVKIAVEEDVDFIGYRIMDGVPEMLVARLMEHLGESGRSEFQVIVGGIVPDETVPELKRLGVGDVFGPGTKISEIVDYLTDHAQAPPAAQ